MNYLAHLYFAEDNAESIIGSLMGDFVKGKVDEALPQALRDGIVLHRKIDAYTDAHPVFRSSKRRLRLEYRRYGGILVDLFYDHFLAENWDWYSSVPLRNFSLKVYRIFADHHEILPGRMQLSMAHSPDA